MGWFILGLLIPIVGLILWIVWREPRPEDSNMSRNGFIAGVILYVISAIIFPGLVG